MLPDRHWVSARKDQNQTVSTLIRLVWPARPTGTPATTTTRTVIVVAPAVSGLSVKPHKFTLAGRKAPGH